MSQEIDIVYGSLAREMRQAIDTGTAEALGASIAQGFHEKLSELHASEKAERAVSQRDSIDCLIDCVSGLIPINSSLLGGFALEARELHAREKAEREDIPREPPTRTPEREAIYREIDALDVWPISDFQDVVDRIRTQLNAACCVESLAKPYLCLTAALAIAAALEKEKKP